ncbi:MAG: penicillin-binding protein 2 [Candidatus Nomurabacteria bacterium]|jgi:cell division protein FtsI/penicillin-binding protein 2|nr:penicillin-binding protein 2 [Candidatus Nomurabacteria bacterium]
MEKTNNFSRVQILLGLLFLAFVILGFRLFKIQVLEHQQWDSMASGIQSQKSIISPNRGEIYTRLGSDTAPLVLNETIYTIFADPQQIVGAQEVFDKVRGVVGDKFEASLEQLGDKSSQYVVLARNLLNVEKNRIKELDLDGVGVQRGSRRFYPEAAMLAQTLGFVNRDGVGQYGVEGEFDEILKGKPGLLTGMTDVSGTFLPTSQYYTRIPSEDGASIVLSFDRNIQYAAEKILADGLKNVNATTGSIIVMDPQDGSVKAMSSLPSYSPADYGKVENANLFLNPIVSNPFEPGSVTKVFTTAAAIDTNVVSKDTTFFNSGCVKIYEDEICNVERKVDGQNLTMTDVLRHSLNTGVVFQLEQMGGGAINDRAKNVLYNYFHDKFRFDELTGIEQTPEPTGQLTAPNSDEAWDIRYANMTFGQGFTTTMIEMATAFCALVNGGTYYQPHLLYGRLDDNGRVAKQEPQVVAKDVVKSTTSDTIRQMMHEARGKKDSEDSGHFVGSKSGTAQIYDAATGKYSEENYIGTHIGFGADAAGQAKYVIMVRVDDSRAGGYAGTIAAGPIFTSMSNWIISYEGITK